MFSKKKPRRKSIKNENSSSYNEKDYQAYIQAGQMPTSSKTTKSKNNFVNKIVNQPKQTYSRNINIQVHKNYLEACNHAVVLQQHSQQEPLPSLNEIPDSEGYQTCHSQQQISMKYHVNNKIVRLQQQIKDEVIQSEDTETYFKSKFWNYKSQPSQRSIESYNSNSEKEGVASNVIINQILNVLKQQEVKQDGCKPQGQMKDSPIKESPIKESPAKDSPTKEGDIFLLDSKSNKNGHVAKGKMAYQHLMITPHSKRSNMSQQNKNMTEDKKQQKSPLSETQWKKPKQNHLKKASEEGMLRAISPLKRNEKTIKYYEKLLSLYNDKIFRINQENHCLKHSITGDKKERPLSFQQVVSKGAPKDFFISQMENYQEDYESLIKELLEKNKQSENQVSCLTSQQQRVHEEQQQRILEYQESILKMKMTLNKQQAQNDELKNKMIALLDEKQHEQQSNDQQLQLCGREIQNLRSQLEAQHDTKMKRAFVQQMKKTVYENKLQECKQEIKQLQESNAKLHQEAEEQRRRQQTREQESEREKEGLRAEWAEQQREYEGRLRRWEQENAELRSQIEQLKQRNEKLARLEETQPKMESRMKSQENEKQIIESIRDSLEKHNRDLKAELGDKQARLDEQVSVQQALKAEVCRSEEAAKQLQKQVTDLKQELRKTKRENLDLEAQYQNIQLEIQERHNQLEMLRKLSDNQQANLQSQESEIHHLQATIRDLRESLASREQEIENYQQSGNAEVQKLKERNCGLVKECELAQLQSQFLQEQVEQLEGRLQKEMEKGRQQREREKQSQEVIRQLEDRLDAQENLRK